MLMSTMPENNALISLVYLSQITMSPAQCVPLVYEGGQILPQIKSLFSP